METEWKSRYERGRKGPRKWGRLKEFHLSNLEDRREISKKFGQDLVKTYLKKIDYTNCISLGSLV